MKPRLRRDWILQHISQNYARGGVDVMNRDFVDEYVDATKAKFQFMCWGANRCVQLGRDLALMVKLGKLERFRCGLGSNWQPGFPKWVWSYYIKSQGET